jgi:hypothetical protein
MWFSLIADEGQEALVVGAVALHAEGGSGVDAQAWRAVRDPHLWA